MREDTKLARIREAMRTESWDAALKLASRFQRLSEHTEAIQRAAKAITSPEIYKSLSNDLAKVRGDGVAALKACFSKSWDEAQQTRSDATG